MHGKPTQPQLLAAAAAACLLLLLLLAARRCSDHGLVAHF